MSAVAAVPADSVERCWVCGGPALVLAKAGNLPPALSADHFKISDSDYGRTADLFRCKTCGFRQASDLPDVLRFYQDMADDAYEHGRDARSTQARMLVRTVARYCSRGRLLDVGAGSGILVAEAGKMGYEAEGIEPSGPLSALAAKHRLNVHHGVLPMAAVRGPFDVATVIDVIEHVPDPVNLLRSVRSVLAVGGYAAVVTPDVSSLMARVLGARWWHYRIAHIGYFDRHTLTLALRTAGFEPVSVLRPGWYFPAGYLIERIFRYLPRFVRFKIPRRLDDVVVPLNLRDSLLVIARRVA
jgi:2-polyprenyl-3-methyl-5-hydroxy-6-metoxy-1,4-benzoquinol methylase